MNKYLKLQNAILLLFVVNILVLHRTPPNIAYLYFAIQLVVLFSLRNGVLLLSYVLLLLDCPGSLIFEGIKEASGRLPYISITSGVTLGYTDIFMILSIIYLFTQKKGAPDTYSPMYVIYVVYGVLLIILSILIGIESSNIVFLLRLSLYYVGFFLFVKRVLIDEEANKNLLACVKVIFAIAISEQVSKLAFGTGLWSFISGQTTQEFLFEEYEGSLGGLRIVESAYINLIMLVLILTQNRMEKKFSIQDLLWMALAYISVFLSATRGWIIAYSFLIISSLLFNKSSRSSLIYLTVASLFIVFFSFGDNNIIGSQLKKSYDRVLTVRSIAEGDLTAEGTLARLTTRNDPVIESWKESPIVGWGFSVQSKSDSHVGNQNVLQVSGIIGFMIIMSGWLLFFYNNIKHAAKNRNMSFSFRSLNMAMMAIIIIHSTSTQVFGYHVTYSPHIKLFIILLIFQISNIYAQRTQVEIKKEVALA